MFLDINRHHFVLAVTRRVTCASLHSEEIVNSRMKVVVENGPTNVAAVPTNATPDTLL